MHLCKEKRYVLTTPIREQTPAEYMAYIDKIYRPKETAQMSKSADNLKLFVKKGKITIRCKRENKEVTEVEISHLALEYGLSVETLKENFLKKKFVVKNELGEPIHVPKRTRAPRKSKYHDERNAHLDQNRAGIPLQDKLLIPGSPTDMPQEIPLQAEQKA